MHWQGIETQISLNDPESRFEFRTLDASVELSFRDWRNRRIHIHFESVSHFFFGYLCPVADFPGAGFYTIKDSQLIEQLRESRFLGQAEPAQHLIVANNEDEFCEVVAEKYRVEIDKA